MITSRIAKCAVAIGAIGLAAVLPSNAKAADAATNAAAQIAVAISIGKNADLDFGTIAEAGVGTVTVNPTTGLRTVTGGVSILGTDGVAADFTVTGEDSATYDIALPVSVSLTGPGTAMTADNFQSDPTVGTGGALSAGPCPCTQNLKVGARLNVNSPQAAGTYGTAATFNVTVSYN